MRKMYDADSDYPAHVQKYYQGLISPFIYSVVSIDSVGRQ